MKTFKSFEEFKKYADRIAKKYKFIISKYNEDYSIDVEGNVILYSKKLTEIPIQFNKVVGDFDCGFNKLTSLEGCPRAAEDFCCTHNQLTSLKGCPGYTKKSFYCGLNYLTSFEGISKNIG